MEKAEQAEEKVDDRKKERMVTEYLINKGLLPATHSHKRAKKDDMTKALTPTTLRRIRGKKATRDALLQAFFDPPPSTMMEKFVQSPPQAPLLQFQPWSRLLEH